VFFLHAFVYANTVHLNVELPCLMLVS